MLATLLYGCGVLALRSHLVLRNKAIILMYHRVLPPELVSQGVAPVQSGMYVTPKSLRLQLSFLKRHFFIVSLSELLRRIQAREDISRCVVITFDDGWLDNYLYAYPILQEFKVPATIFLATGLIGTLRWFWPEEIGWAVRAIYSDRLAIFEMPPLLVDMLRNEMTAANGVGEAIENIITAMKPWGERQKAVVAKFCALLRQSLGGTPERLLMNWQEVKEVASSGLVSFGSHTVSHALLDSLPAEQIQGELAESIAEIQAQTERAVEVMAYPNGNYNRMVLSLVPACGIKAAVSTRRGYVQPNSPPFELPRIGMHEDVGHTAALFQWRLVVR
jgi:peptidoglycan/xylan/chitin deacetylase (PgdA/CDA1 family)